MINIGGKIKQLRKERKMTLVEVAGDKLSKGMLSLIENGKAQPSMESLQHIASQLNIDVSELMQSKDSEEIKALYLHVEPLLVKLNKMYEDVEYDAHCRKILTLIEPYMADGRLNGARFEEIRLTEIYHLMHYYLKMTHDLSGFESCIARYKQIHAYSKVVSGYCRLGGMAFQVQNYEQSIEWLLLAVECTEHFAEFIGEIEKLDLYYNLTVVYAALNNDVESEKYMQFSLKLAHDKKIIYRLNDLYRYLFFIAIAKNNGEQAQSYFKKIHAFSVILEDPLDLAMEDLLEFVYWNHIDKAYDKVIATPINYRNFTGKLKDQLDQFVNGEKAYAHYQLQQINEALSCLENIVGPELYHHPTDAARIYRAFAIRALSYLESGDIENAKRDILYAADGVKNYAPSIDKTFIDEAYEKIM